MRRKRTTRRKSLNNSSVRGVDNRPSTIILEKIKETGRTTKRIKGLSISTKFAIAISVLSVVICAFSGFVVYYKTKDSLIEEIDRKGAALIKVVTNMASEYYEAMQKNIDNSDEQIKILAKFQQYVKSIARTSDGSKKSSEILGVIIKSNVSKISSIGDYGISGGYSEIYYEKRGDETYETKISILQGNIETFEEKKHRTRSYKKNILDGKITIYVTLSDYEINRTAEEIYSSILYASLLAILFGIASSFVLTSHITTPIRKLMDDINKIGKGNLNHRTIVRSKDEIGVLASTINAMTESLKNANRSELDQQAREHELKIATEIQSSLLPKQIPQIPGYDIAAFYHPSKEVGGDYYDFIDIDNENMAIVVADVSGKGIPGSMVMTMTRSLIRSEALRNLSTTAVLIAVNKVIAQDITRGMFVTAMYGILNKRTGEFKVTSAGHNPAILIKQNGQYELVNTSGLALGFDKGNIFNKKIEEKSIIIKKGERLVLYTDGIPEAMSPRNDEFGDERFYELANNSTHLESKKFVENIVTNIARWRKNAPQSDDITIVTIKHRM